MGVVVDHLSNERIAGVQKMKHGILSDTDIWKAYDFKDQKCPFIGQIKGRN